MVDQSRASIQVNEATPPPSTTIMSTEAVQANHTIANNNNTSSSSTATSNSTSINHKQSIDSLKNIELPFDTPDLYKISFHFFKENESKAFHPSYDERNALVAYTLQEKYGKFNAEKARPLGALDFVGHDRRNAWIALSEMTKEDAQREFIKSLDKMCPLFRPYVAAVRCDLDEKARVKREAEEAERRSQLEAEEAEKRREREAEELEEARRQKYESQKRIIQDILNEQTFHRFDSYARQQYPDNVELQRQLITQLQEQHFQQYMQQMMEQPDDLLLLDNAVQSLSNSNTTSTATTTTTTTTTNNNNNNNKNDHNDNVMSGIDGDNVKSNKLATNAKPNRNAQTKHEQVEDSEEEDDEDDEEEEEEEEADEEEEEEEEEEDNAEDGDVSPHRVVSNASMWTRKDIGIFKDTIRSEGTDGILKVGHGEIATIRVPTHENGNCIFWEFATDSYDIGFGLLFEWNPSPDSQVSIHISESEDDDDDEGEIERSPNDVETGVGNANLELMPSKLSPSSPSSSSNDPSANSVIIPIYRRDSHEEVFAGSHFYPGKGVYLLKFDNSYSLWRSKTLYYRVYYTKET